MSSTSSVKKIFLTRAQAAAVLGVSGTTMRRLQERGVLRAVKHTPSEKGRVYFYLDDVEAYAAGLSRTPEKSRRHG